MNIQEEENVWKQDKTYKMVKPEDEYWNLINEIKQKE